MAARSQVTGASPGVQTGNAPWLFGPWVDLSIGCGLAYLLTLPLLVVLTERFGVVSWPFACVGLFTLAINGPHYGATLVRVYEQRADRRKYVFFTVYLTLFIIGAFFAGLANAWLGSLLITLYVSWSPWHFSGQNYGLAVMFLRRGGFDMPKRAVRLLQVSFVLSFALALLAMHVSESTAVYAPSIALVEGSYGVLRLGIPREVAIALFAGVGVAYLGCLVVATALLRRVAPWRNLVPVLLLVLTQSLWFVVPATLEFARDVPAYALPFAAVWISTAHSAQYLWVSAYYSSRGGRHDRTGAFLLKCVGAGTAATVLPGVLLAPAFVGAVSWSAGLGALAGAVVNLHHFMLDGAIWKLRDGRVARILVRAQDAPLAEAPGTTRFATTVFALGGLLLLVPLVETWEVTAVSRPVPAKRLEASARRLSLVGRAHPDVWSRLGGERQHAGDIEGAIAAYRESLRLAPGHRNASSHLAWLLAVYHGDDPALAEEAVTLAEQASASARHRNPIYLDTLAVAQAATGRFDEAERTARRALRFARGSRRPRLVSAIEGRLELFASERPLQRTPSSREAEAGSEL